MLKHFIRRLDRLHPTSDDSRAFFDVRYLCLLRFKITANLKTLRVMKQNWHFGQNAVFFPDWLIEYWRFFAMRHMRRCWHVGYKNKCEFSGYCQWLKVVKSSARKCLHEAISKTFLCVYTNPSSVNYETSSSCFAISKYMPQGTLARFSANNIYMIVRLCTNNLKFIPGYVRLTVFC
jgi:hypothetical protein